MNKKIHIEKSEKQKKLDKIRTRDKAKKYTPDDIMEYLDLTNERLEEIYDLIKS